MSVEKETVASYDAEAPIIRSPTTGEKHDEEVDAFGPAPDGGLTAWLVAIGASCTIFSTLGFANSFGVLQEYYAVHQLEGKAPDDIAWIGSLSAFLQFATGAIAGPLFDRYGAWVCTSYLHHQ